MSYSKILKFTKKFWELGLKMVYKPRHIDAYSEHSITNPSRWGFAIEILGEFEFFDTTFDFFDIKFRIFYRNSR